MISKINKAIFFLMILSLNSCYMFDTRFAKDNNLNHITFGIYKKKYNGHAKGVFYKNNVRRSKSCGSLDDAKYKIDNYCNNDNQCIKEAIAFHYGLVGNEFVNRYNQMQKYCDAEKKSNNNSNPFSSHDQQNK